ncbi:MAG: IS4 family transposase [Planctomycetaceae bacterium]|jgi:hypothetical protein|nr:IS4 family transposase [Planctomycetaceae bacterium]
MRRSSYGWCRQQFDFLRRQFLQADDLPLSDVLSEEIVAGALAKIGVAWRDRLYPPLVTLWVFLGQVLSADQSCRAAVARLIAHRVSQGQESCSAETGAYCQARKRLPEEFFSEVARQTGRALDTDADSQWLWKDRRVYLFDGSTVSMPDTPANQAAYPQPETQRPGVGFPMARIAAVFSLACGAVLELGICRYAGKGQSEQGMLRAMWEMFRPGDVLLTDRLMCSWVETATLKGRGVDSVTRLSSNRTADFRRGKRLGKGDHIVQWPKPLFKPRSIDRETYNALPEFITVRETRVLVEQPGFRSRRIIVVTTLLDTDAISADDLSELYRARWNIELDLRALKETMQMNVLRCKTPELVRKELWTHLLGYNLIRTMIAQAALKHDINPRTISFKGATQTLKAFQPAIAILGREDAAVRITFYQQILDAIVAHRVADRPDRFEPHRRKRRSGKHDLFTKSRHDHKRDILKRVSQN